jgi:hypothetical protein
MKPLFRVLICGDRDWNDWTRLREIIAQLPGRFPKHEILIIEGGAIGADVMAREVAHEYNIHTAEVKALWNTRRKGAGPQRNDVMLAMEPDLVLGFHNRIRQSKGTRNMLNKSFKAGIPTWCYTKGTQRRLRREIPGTSG